MKKEFNSKKIIISIIVILAVVLLINNFNDVTGFAVAKRGSPGSWSYCSYNNIGSDGRRWICTASEGDCDRDADCESGLKCIKDAGANYGWSSTIDVCEETVSGVSKPAVSKPVAQSCTNECTPGARECLTDATYQRCVMDFDADTCYEWESFRCASGQICQSDSGKCVTTSTQPVPEQPGYISLGSSFVESLSDNNGILRTSENLKVETSLTAAEDDYQTDVVMEVAKDSIRYYYIPNENLIGKTFTFLGNTIRVVRAGSYGTTMVAEVNGKTDTIKDGDAFIGENSDKPKWVWDLSGLDTSKPSVNIENDFIWNDDSDNPAKVGECIYLPNNYAKICLDSLNVNKYDTYTIEYESSADLSEAGGTSSGKTILIKTTKNGGISLSGGPSTNYIWITGDGRVYYKDISTNKVKYWKTVGFSETIGKLNNDLDLSITKESDNIDININSAALKETLSAHFKVRDGQVQSLGGSNSYEEATELIWGIQGRDTLNIGTKDEDHRTAYGIIIRDPKSHGASDEVVLDIPSKQVKAKVSMSFNAAPTPPQPISEEKICNLDTKCFLNSGETALIDGDKIELENVGPEGGIRVRVSLGGNAVSSVPIPSQTTAYVYRLSNNNVFNVKNIETYYDPNNQAASAATLIISKPKCTDSDKGTYYNVKGTCEDGAISIKDVCDNNGKVLYEVDCSENVCGRRGPYTCPNGCSNGACLVPSSGGAGGGSGSPIIKSDFNSDGCVDFKDFVLLSGVYGKKTGDSGYNSKYDLESDGKIDNSDFVIYARDYGKGCP